MSETAAQSPHCGQSASVAYARRYTAVTNSAVERCPFESTECSARVSSDCDDDSTDCEEVNEESTCTTSEYQQCAYRHELRAARCPALARLEESLAEKQPLPSGQLGHASCKTGAVGGLHHVELTHRHRQPRSYKKATSTMMPQSALASLAVQTKGGRLGGFVVPGLAWSSVEL